MLDKTDSNRPERRSALIAHELPRLDVDIAALSKVHFPEESSIRSIALDTPSSGQENLQQRGVSLALASCSEPPQNLPPS